MNKNNLIKILAIQSASYEQFRVFAYIIRQCKKLGVDYYVDNGNIYITKGITEIYPCIVAHMDTVHELVEDLTVIEVNGNLTGFNAAKMEQTGIGGDDKVGIFIALECLHLCDNIKVAFFRDEEVGCEGSYKADLTFFNDCSFVLQCDRKGNGDFITEASMTELSSKDFLADVGTILPQYGYKFEKGMMTDVMALKESGVKCSLANISCGYYNPHMENEYVNLADVENCLDMVMEIIYSMGDTIYYHEYEYKPTYYPRPYEQTRMGKYGLWEMDDDLGWAGKSKMGKNGLWEMDDDLDWTSKSKIRNYEYEALCGDCWQQPAVKDRLCLTCLSYYEDTYFDTSR